MNVIASFSLKVTDLYKLSFTEFLNKKPENKKLKKENQNKNYNLYEQKRQNNINKCLEKYRELKNNKNNNKNIKEKRSSIHKKIFHKELEKMNISDDEIEENEIKPKKSKKKSLINNSGILCTDNNYIFKHYEGINTSVKKEELDNVTCLNNEKSILEKKMEENNCFLKNILKSEIMKENKIRKIQQKINKKEEKINEFIQDKKEGIRFLENERYKDLKDREDKKKLYDKMMKNFGLQINISNKNNNNLIKKEKNEELKEQINNYEKKNALYKKRITEIFDIDSNNNKLKISLPKGYDNKTPDQRQKKLLEIEDKYEMDIMKRENAFINRINIMQNKINNLMDKKEKKNNRIKQSLEKRNKIREDKKVLQDLMMDEIKEKLQNNKIQYEKKRLQKLENLEQKNLKDYAIKQEKLKIYEERKRISQKTSQEKELMLSNLKKLIRRQNNNNKIKDDENSINKILYNN